MNELKSFSGRFFSLNSFLREKFGERTLKICVDGGFTCPNRDGKCGTGGCIFCGEKGSGEHLRPDEITEQVKRYLSSYKAARANKFIVYFQNFTGTYAPVQTLKVKYDSALCSDKIVGLAIATRPDCIDEDVAKLLNEYQKKYFVYVELGLQTASDETAKTINRCYKTETFISSVKLLAKHGIPVVAHIMIGLPGEGYDELDKTINLINTCKVWGVKIHSVYVIKNTKLEQLYKSNEYTPLTLDEYIEKACYCITHLDPKITVHRISGDAPKDLLVAPEWNAHKKPIMNGIIKKLGENDLYQGKYFSGNGCRN